MGKKVLFLDSVEKGDGSYNVTYGTDDINAIVRSLTGAGVSIFPSGETFNVSDLNSITESMVSAGVSFDGLRVSLSNGKIHIAPGIGFFENGAIITVDADGAELEYKVSENVYVYAEYDKTLNICDFRTSEEAPVDAEGVYRLILAVIEADGTVNDRRTMAVSKVATMGRNAEFEFPDVFVPTGADGNHPVAVLEPGKTVWEGEIDLSRFNYILSSYATYRSSYEITQNCTRISDLETQDVRVAYLGTNYASLYLHKEGPKVSLRTTASNNPLYIYTDVFDGDVNYIRFV